MQIRESGKIAFKVTGAAISTSKNYLTAMSGEQEDKKSENMIDPTKYMTVKEARKWNRLSDQKKQQYIDAGIKNVKRTMRTKNRIFRDEDKFLENTEKKIANQYLNDIRERIETDRASGQESILIQTKDKKSKFVKNNNIRGAEEKIDSREFSKENIQNIVSAEKMTEGTKKATEFSSTTVKATQNATTVAETGMSSTGIGTVAVAGKKTADKFKEYMQAYTVAREQALKDVQSKMQGIKEENQRVDNFPAAVKFVSASMGTAILAIATVIMQVALSIVTMIISVLIGLLVPIIAIISVVSAIVSIIAALTTSSDPAGYGLPDFVTQDMMQTFFEIQESDGVPVSTGLAQLIAESGFGSYGPGGDNGRGLSGLAYNYHNLFGIKYSTYDKYATGVVNLSTNEENSVGEIITIKDGFSVYEDYKSCILQRAYMLTHGTYKTYTSSYKNPCDGTYTKEAAKNYMQGIKNGGWATSSVYVESCIEHMDEYNLYQFDNMTWEDFQNNDYKSSYDGIVTSSMQKIVDTAKNNAGTYPCTPDMCAAWVTGVYQAAGASIVPYGNAIDMWNVFKNTGSTDMSNIPPGAIVCGSGSGYMGSLYGHVGVYVGNGMVANNIGRFSIESLQSWCAWQTATCQGHTGWIGWVYPGGVPTE